MYYLYYIYEIIISIKNWEENLVFNTHTRHHRNNNEKNSRTAFEFEMEKKTIGIIITLLNLTR